jgi:hypothetical protein
MNAGDRMETHATRKSEEEIDVATPDEPQPEGDPETRAECRPDPDSPGATIDDPVVAEPNEPG